MDTITQNKTAILSLVLLILAFFGYSYFFGGSSDVMVAQVNTAAGTELIELSRELSGINFNQDLFATPGYRQLVDFGSEVLPQPIGRPNPFGAIGRD
jgi:hypothetical protein